MEEDLSAVTCVNQSKRDISESLIEIDSISSCDSNRAGNTANTVLGQRTFSGSHRTPPPDTGSSFDDHHTRMDSGHSPYSGSVLSVSGFFETASLLDRDQSDGRWSEAVEVSSTASAEKCSSRSSSSQNTVPASPSSTSSRSEASEDLSSERRFHVNQNSAVVRSSPAAAFRRGGSLKNRLLQRAGVFTVDNLPPSLNTEDLRDLHGAGKQSEGVYLDSLPPLNSQVLRESRPADVNVDRSPSAQSSQELTEVQAPGTRRDGIHVGSRSPESSQYLAEMHRLAYMPSAVVRPPPGHAVYPSSLYQRGPLNHEAAATAALFYNQLAALHQLQRHQQRIFVGGGGRNPVTMPCDSHSSRQTLHATQSESANAAQLQPTEPANGHLCEFTV